MWGSFWGLFFGAFWGALDSAPVEEPDEDEPVIPFPGPADLGYTDHVHEALDRLCEQFRGDPDS